MNKIKQAYNRPTTEILVIRFEGMLLQSTTKQLSKEEEDDIFSN